MPVLGVVRQTKVTAAEGETGRERGRKGGGERKRAVTQKIGHKRPQEPSRESEPACQLEPGCQKMFWQCCTQTGLGCHSQESGRNQSEPDFQTLQQEGHSRVRTACFPAILPTLTVNALRRVPPAPSSLRAPSLSVLGHS